MYSVLTFKATRPPQLVVAGISEAQAITKAGDLFDSSKVFAAHGFLVTGVSVIVMSDDNAKRAVESGLLPPLSEDAVVYQCGGF